MSQEYRRIADYYDHLYKNTERPWSKIAGRGDDFERYFAALIEDGGVERYLDIGCGQGHLVSAVRAKERCGIDISRRAIEDAAARKEGQFCVGIAEELPYATGYFDSVSSVGVMTHLLDDVGATQEIYRVLASKGKYVVGVYLPPPAAKRLFNAARSFAKRMCNPDAWLTHLRRKLRSINGPPSESEGIEKRQPVEVLYSSSQLARVFAIAGFTVERIISKSETPDAPLSSSCFHIFVLRKKETFRQVGREN